MTGHKLCASVDAEVRPFKVRVRLWERCYVMTISYAVQALSEGRWFIDGVYDRGGNDQAIEHARRLYGEPDIADVKVIRDISNGHVIRSSEEVVFEAMLCDGLKAA